MILYTEVNYKWLGTRYFFRSFSLLLTSTFMLRVLIVLISCIPLVVQAQLVNPCVDSNRVNPFYQCNDPAFDPVCGCNNVTYRNGCEMTNVGGVNFPAPGQSGVCLNDLFFYDFYPNPIRNILNFNMQFASLQTAPANLQIYNVYGTIVYSQLLNNLADFPTPPNSINLTGIESGVYVLLIQSKGVSKISKFIKHTP